MMRLIRPTSLITLCTLLVISLFSQVPNSAEQWLTTLLLASLVAVFLMVGSGCRHFLRE
jgi:uncharacterized BrkB/YihY/UPF0761 family membrane protein